MSRCEQRLKGRLIRWTGTASSAKTRSLADKLKVSGENPILIDQYLVDAIEVDVDCIADMDGNVHVAGVMEHIEEAGIHSGDSACSLPPYTLGPAEIERIRTSTLGIAKNKVRRLIFQSL